MSVILTLIILGLIIFVHELGHFVMAKKYGMGVSEFSIGMGPKIFSILKGETRYSIRLIPLGGFVNIDGMLDEDDENIDKSKWFVTKSKLQRFNVLIAGIVMNFITGFISLWIYTSLMGISFINTVKMYINIFIMTINGIILLFSGGVPLNDMTGPVGLPIIIQQSYTNYGYIFLFFIFALLSVNIGLMNLLPIPALDGGRILFILLESIGIKVKRKTEEIITTIGVIILLLLMILIVFGDIQKYIN